MTTPDWLRDRGGELKLGSDRKTWYVFIGGKPIYDLVVLPAEGKHSCAVRMTNNGQTLESPGEYPTSDDALRGGLESLKVRLGWA